MDEELVQASLISSKAKWFLSPYVPKPLNLPRGCSSCNFVVASISTLVSVLHPNGSHFSTSIKICSGSI